MFVAKIVSYSSVRIARVFRTTSAHWPTLTVYYRMNEAKSHSLDILIRITLVLFNDKFYPEIYQSTSSSSPSTYSQAALQVALFTHNDDQK